MPIPTPNNNESRDDFMTRCVSFVVNEGTPREQAIAICSQQWDDNKIATAKEINVKKMNFSKDILK